MASDSRRYRLLRAVLAAALAANYGRELVLNVQVDPEVLGGVRVQVGDEVMNSTVADRLAEVHRKLAS